MRMRHLTQRWKMRANLRSEFRVQPKFVGEVVRHPNLRKLMRTFSVGNCRSNRKRVKWAWEDKTPFPTSPPLLTPHGVNGQNQDWFWGSCWFLVLPSVFGHRYGRRFFLRLTNSPPLSCFAWLGCVYISSLFAFVSFGSCFDLVKKLDCRIPP